MSTGFVTDRDGTWINKGPKDNLLYTADISEWLKKCNDPGPLTDGGVVSATLTVTNVSVSPKSIDFNLSGGVVGSKHIVEVSWSTAKNPNSTRSFTVRIVNR